MRKKNLCKDKIKLRSIKETKTNEDPEKSKSSGPVFFQHIQDPGLHSTKPASAPGATRTWCWKMLDLHCPPKKVPKKMQLHSIDMYIYI